MTESFSLPTGATGAGGDRAELWAVSRRFALTINVIVLLGELLFAALDLRLVESTLLPWMRVLHALACAVAATWLVNNPARMHVRWSVAAALVAVLPLLLVFWTSETAMAGAGQTWSPFTGHRLVVICLAFLMPGPVWLVVLLMGVFAAQALSLWLVLDLGLHPGVAAGEPYISLIYGVLGLALLAYRTRMRHLQLEFERARAHATAMERLARVSLAVRDGANTPLQTLEAAAALLDRKDPSMQGVTERIRRSIARLRELVHSLAVYESRTWKDEDESFDARDALARAEQEWARRSRPPVSRPPH